jgi:rRNA maturation endonuclease Nob1
VSTRMGDDACWLNRVCLECGRFIDEDRTEELTCPYCGAELTPAAPTDPGTFRVTDGRTRR